MEVFTVIHTTLASNTRAAAARKLRPSRTSGSPAKPSVIAGLAPKSCLMRCRRFYAHGTGSDFSTRLPVPRVNWNPARRDPWRRTRCR